MLPCPGEDFNIFVYRFKNIFISAFQQKTHSDILIGKPNCSQVVLLYHATEDPLRIMSFQSHISLRALVYDTW